MATANKTYDYGLGRRKSATATARLVKGKGAIVINGKPASEYLSDNKAMLAEITDPLALVGKQAEFDVSILVKGGGLSGQVDAIKMAIAKAITVGAPDLRSPLKKAELLRRDPREKERKKYGLRSARKREQYSKR
ncbi:30S ribosomal protein S9 [Candidatus Saccharibacteria bacterium]|nr:30S ribosomal protein S9 [Patescibacteria group bacterium]MCA9336745.1 30S ribosomal protein S9 [Candidatus Saccharibacteria bacterium]